MYVPFPPLIPGFFVQRLHRFGAVVKVEGEEVPAHVASSGRMKELLFPGARVWVKELDGRKSRCQLWLVEGPAGKVCVNAQWPNRVAEELLRHNFWPGLKKGPFAGYDTIKPEAPSGRSRFDFLLRGPEGDCFVEVKSVTLVEGGVALFPDAPTARGARHLEELTELRLAGCRAAVLLMVQRDDAVVFEPNGRTDPAFSVALSGAAEAGVEIYALSCRVSITAMEITRQLPVKLSPGLPATGAF